MDGMQHFFKIFSCLYILVLAQRVTIFMSGTQQFLVLKDLFMKEEYFS